MLSSFQFYITYQGKRFLGTIIFSSTLQMAKILHQIIPQNKKDAHELEQVQGRMPVSQGPGIWDLHGEMKELDLFNGRYGQQWPCCSCEAVEQKEMELYWGQPKWSEKPPVQTEVQEVLNRNEVSKNHSGDKCALERLLQRLGNFAHFQDSTTHSPWQSSLSSTLTPGLGELQRSFPASVVCDYDVLNLGKVPEPLRSRKNQRNYLFWKQACKVKRKASLLSGACRLKKSGVFKVKKKI